MKLNKYQEKALGINQYKIPEYVWTSELSRIYEKIDNKNKEMEEQGQTYPEFLQMQQLEPNQYGTGRYKFSVISRIEYIFIPKGPKKITIPTNIRNNINRLLNVYLRLPTEQNSKLHIYFKGNSLINNQDNLQFFLKREQERFDVYDLLDVLMEYREDKTILIGLIESGLQEDGNQLDGRACGDGVAVIGFSRGDLDKNLDQLLQTVLHQTLHTLGFDHCIAWKCLMNAYTNFQAWLCPACSMKLYHELNIKSRNDAYQWAKSVTEIMQILKSRKNAKKGRQLMKALID